MVRSAAVREPPGTRAGCPQGDADGPAGQHHPHLRLPQYKVSAGRGWGGMGFALPSLPAAPSRLQLKAVKRLQQNRIHVSARLLLPELPSSTALSVAPGFLALPVP